MPFLTATWSNLILLTYDAPPELLQHRLPGELELDTRDGDAFASLVAFDFLDTRVLGVAWPGFRSFPEVNLRFYVRRKDDGARVTPFDLDTLDVESLGRAWRLESSSGAVFNVPSTGTINFAAQPGWQNISYFDIIHNPAEANGTIQVDNVAVTFVPEPAIAGAVAGLALSLLARRQRRRLA